MNQLLKTRCTKGQLVIYEDRVALELKGFGVHKTNSLGIKQITGVEVNTVMSSMFGMGGVATVKIFGLGDQTLEANMVKLKEAKKAEEIINGLISKNNDPVVSNVNDLEKLAELKSKGVLTEEEFEQKKKQILGI